jgi:cytochrome c-type biogenesis protein CcmF
LAAWLLLGTVAEWLTRIRFGQVNFAEALERARKLPLSVHGAGIAHAGLAVVIAGIVGSSAWKTESIQTMRPGDSTNVAGYQFRLDAVTQGRGANYSSVQGSFTVTKDGRPIAVLDPEKRQYTAPPRPTTEAAIHTSLTADLYAVIGDETAQGVYVTRLYHNPLVPWMWAGALMMAGGGLVSLFDRRHRVGAPRRAKAAIAAQPAE